MKDTEPEETVGFFKFWYERLMMRVSFAFAFFAFLGVFVYAYFTEVMMDSPGQTAPFVESISPQTDAQKSLAEQQILPLDIPHRTDRELKTWITTAVSESLFFDADNFPQVKQQVSGYFTASGIRAYENYLRSSGLLSNMRNNNYRLSVFIEGKALLLNALEIDGVYRWLYRVPLTMSFMPKNPNIQIRREDIINRKVNLQIQIRRTRLPDNPEAIQIESWTMTGRPG